LKKHKNTNGILIRMPRFLNETIFYPVLNEAYATEIATRWNLDDESSGYSGFVTAFDMDASFLEEYPVKNVGELWIPAEELELFNTHIVGDIRLIKAWFGEKYQPPTDINLNELIQKMSP